jgi:hypothetical protein
VLAAVDGMTAEAIVFAVARAWVLVEAGHSICLTDAGRRLVEAASAECGIGGRHSRSLAGDACPRRTNL